MFSASLEFFVSAAAVVMAARYLTKFTDRIAELTNLGRGIAGMLLLALATSLPELSVDSSAALMGAADLAVGDLLGSSLMNLLILGVLDMVTKERGRMLSKMAAAHALTGTVVILLTVVPLLFLLLRPEVVLFGRLGLGPIFVAVVYLVCVRLVYLDQQLAGENAEEPPSGSQATLRQAILGYLIATVVIFAAAPVMAQAADRIAMLSGLGRTFIGTTLVALSTSLPEMVSTYVAVRMGAFDLAIGNVMGSNAFNMVILLPVDLFQPGSLFAMVSQTHAVTAAWVILVTAVVTMSILYKAERRFLFVEPDAAMVVLLVIAALVSVYYLG